MRMFISLIHWVRKEISFHWRETDETCWAFGAIFFYSSLTLFDCSGAGSKGSFQSKPRTSLSALHFKLLTNLFPVPFRVVNVAHSAFFWCGANEEIVSRFWHLPMPAFARLTDFRFQIYDDHKGKQQKKTHPKQTNNNKKKKKAGTFEHRDCGHCFWPCALLSLTYSQMNCESHYHACRSEIPKREECHLRTLPTVYVYAKNWLCWLMMWGFGKSKPRKVKRTLVCPGS